MLTIQQVDFNNTQQTDELLSLLNAYALDPMGGGEPLPEATQAVLIQEMAKRDGVYSFIAYHQRVNDRDTNTDVSTNANTNANTNASAHPSKNRQAVGLVNCVEGFSTFAAKPLCNIHDIAVLPEYRGQGIAQALMRQVCEYAKQRGCCKVTLEVLTGNTRARNAYRAFGFAPYQLDPTLGSAEFWEFKLT